jgi:hypothetical protein
MDDEFRKMLEELASLRKEQKDKIKDRIKNYDHIMGGISFDFASLYPSSMTMRFPSKQSIRKNKIKKIFQ